MYIGFYILNITGTAELEIGTHLSPTASAVFQLSKTLPYTTYQFSLFCNNLFSKVELFSQLQRLELVLVGQLEKMSQMKYLEKAQ
jgi:hypothetical protein